MLFTKWLSDVTNRVLRKRTSRFARKVRKVARPTVSRSSEALECRVVPTINVDLTAGVLAITEDGLGDNNNLTVSGDGAGNFVLTSSTDTFTITADDTTVATGDGTSTVTIGNSTVASTTVALGDGDDTIVVNSVESGSLTVDGEGGSDTLRWNVAAGLGLTAASAIDGFDGLSDDVSFSNINSVVGNAASGLFNLTGNSATWEISGSSSVFDDGVATIGFSGFSFLAADNSGDTFNVNSATTVSLIGGADNDTFNIDAQLTGYVDGDVGTDTLQGALISNVSLDNAGAIDGFDGTEADVTSGFFDIDAITGNGGTLNGLDAESTWDFTGVSTYTSGNSLTIDGFTTLQGGLDVDIFNISNSVNFNLTGGAGADEFNLDAALTGSLNGEADTDVLQGSEVDNVTLTSSGVTGFSGNENSISGGFAGIDSLVGNGGSLTGIGANSTWNLGSTPTYETASAPPLEIVGFTTLQGGSAVDIFNITGDSAFDLNGGLGNDKINILGATLSGVANGGGGNDTLDGQTSTGSLNLQGGDGNDMVIGGGSNDILDGGLGNDRLFGQAGDDILTGGSGNDSLNGGADNDRVVETINGNATVTNTRITGGNGTDTLTQVEELELTGNSGNNLLDASAYTLGAVSLTGGDGNDTLAGGALFGDVLDGGDGIDLVKANVAGTVTLSDADLVASGLTDVLFNIEAASLTGSASDDDIDATNFSGSATIVGGAGNDTITGAAGASLLNGNNGNDVISGQAENDSLLGGTGNDTLDGGDGDDRVNGNDGDDSIDGGLGNDTMTGDGGKDTMTGGDGDDKIDAGAANDTVFGESGADNILGGAGLDSIEGGDGDDTLNGNADNDRIEGGEGNDQVFGGAGSDVLLGENGDDSLNSQSGNDTMIGGNGGDDDGNDTLTGGAGNELMFGGDGNDSMNGGAGNDTIIGDDGDDTILGGAGNDLCLGGLGGDDYINGQAGKDTLGGGGDQDTVVATSGESIDNATHDDFYSQFDATVFLD